MQPAVLIPLYCLLIVGASLAGGVLPSVVELTHTRMQLIVSFVAGLMLGVALFHMLPHAARDTRSLDQAVGWMVFGLLGMFFLIRAFHFHQHEVDDHGPGHGHRLSWVGVAIGLSLHTAIDGVALAASVMAEKREGHALLFGLGTFIAILLHKPLDALAITSLMKASGWNRRLRHMVNAAFALMCPLGAALFYFGVGMDRSVAVGCALALSAGVFLCIALADLLPEVQFHKHDRIKLSAALILGVVLAYGIGFLESGFHDHAHHP